MCTPKFKSLNRRSRAVLGSTVDRERTDAVEVGDAQHQMHDDQDQRREVPGDKWDAQRAPRRDVGSLESSDVSTLGCDVG